MISFLQRFWQYQQERFPLLVLMATTSAVVFSSAGVQQVTVTGHGWQFVAAIFLGLTLLFTMRVLDERRDFTHDNTYHQDRPLQRGLITFKELYACNTILVIIALCSLLLLGVIPFIIGLCTFLFCLVAGRDFFLHRYLKHHFLFYNAVNLLQMFGVQLLIYAVLDSSFSLSSSLLWLHFIFAILNSVLLEIVRKIKPPAEESNGNDTYSWRLGFRGAILLYTIMVLCVLMFYVICIKELGALFSLWSIVVLFATCVTLLIALLYNYKRVAILESCLIGATVCLYLLFHFSFYFL